jgi:hypothetical protein
MGQTRRFEHTAVVLLGCLALLIATYWIARFGGYIMEGDATRLTQAAEGILREGRLINDQSYSNGYGYSAALAFLSAMTGVTIQDIQLAGSLWLVVIALAAFLTYRELLGSGRAAALGLFLLLCQCDFLFYILRSSHERSTWTFGLLVLWLWARSMRTELGPARAAMGALLYVLLWGIIANNAFFGSTLLLTFTIMVLLGLGLQAVLPRLPHLRVAATLGVVKPVALYVLLGGAALIFLFTNYLYPPAISYYYTFQLIGERVAVLLFGSETAVGEAAVGGVGYVQEAWVSRQAYLVLTGFQWAVLLASGAAWLRDALGLVRRGTAALSRPRLLLWLFYTGYATQMALGVISDLSGAMGGNLQVRLFTPFSLLVCPMAATWLFTLGRRAWLRRPLPRRIVVGFGTAIGCVAVSLSLFKLTNDPVAGNYWLFYTPGEQAAVDWVDAKVAQRTIWLDTWPHQHDILQNRRGYTWVPANEYDSGYVTAAESDFYSHVVLSEATIYQANRSRLPLPAVADRNQVYDNGDTQVYHRRQRSPFQR